MARWISTHFRQGGLGWDKFSFDRFIPRREFPLGWPTVNWAAVLSGYDDGNNGHVRPRLSFAESEQQTLEVLYAAGVRELDLRPRVDVDSCFFGVTSPYVYRGGFMLSWNPLYVQNIRQNQYLFAWPGGGNRRQGRRLLRMHKMKHVEFGCGSLCHGLKCHIGFPEMPLGVTGQETYLDSAQLEEWVQILVAALAATVDPDICAHHPQSPRTVRLKARVKREYTDLGTDGTRDIPFAKPIPEEWVESFWEKVRDLCGKARGFANPVLWVTGHDFKAWTKTKDRLPRTALDKFITTMKSHLRWEEALIPASHQWVDFAAEWEATPVPRDDCHAVVPKVVLLWKTECLREWSKLFQDPHGDHPRLARSSTNPQKRARRKHDTTLRAQTFLFHLTRDASTCTFITAPFSTRRRIDGIAHGKAYNIHHEYSSSPLHDNRQLFDEPRIEGVGFTQETYENLYRANSARGKQASADSAEKGQFRFLYAGQRGFNCLDDTEDLASGLRIELRVHLPSLNDSTLEDISTMKAQKLALSEIMEGRTRKVIVTYCEPLDIDRHRAFWILDSRQLNHFVKAILFRSYAVIQTLGAQTQHVSGLPDIRLKEQLHNSLMVTVLTRLLTRTVSGLDPVRDKSLWEQTWKRPAKYDGRTKDKESRTVLGLHLKKSTLSRGLAWISAGLLEAARPRFRQDIIQDFGFASNAFLTHFNRLGPRTLTAKVTLDDDIEAKFRRACSETREYVLCWNRGRTPQAPFQSHTPAHRLGAEIVIALFVRQMWAFLCAQAGCSASEAAEPDVDFLRPLHEQERLGLCGMSLEMVSRLLDYQPEIVAVRPDTAKPGSPDAFDYASRSWVERVGKLFRWTDRRPPQKPRSWDKKHYRAVARRLHSALQQAQGPDSAAIFEDVVCAYASCYLLLVPNFDRGNFCRAGSTRGNPHKQSKFVIATIPSRRQIACLALYYLNQQAVVQSPPSRASLHDPSDASVDLESPAEIPPGDLSPDERPEWGAFSYTPLRRGHKEALVDEQASFETCTEEAQFWVRKALLETDLEAFDSIHMKDGSTAASIRKAARSKAKMSAPIIRPLRSSLDLQNPQLIAVHLRLTKARQFYRELHTERDETDLAVAYEQNPEEEEEEAEEGPLDDLAKWPLVWNSHERDWD